MIKFSNKKFIEVRDWDNLVKKTYKRSYNFQQQDGCKERKLVEITIPDEFDIEDWEGEYVPLQEWLAKDPNETDEEGVKDDWRIEMWWEREFYPNVQEIANDLHKKGLIEAGDYTINIDW